MQHKWFLMIALWLVPLGCGGTTAGTGPGAAGDGSAISDTADLGDAAVDAVAAKDVPDKDSSSKDPAEGGGETVGDGGEVCNSLVNDAVPIFEVNVASPPPIAAGGIVTDGRYHLTMVENFMGTGGKSGVTPAKVAETLEISGATWSAVAFTPEVYRASFTVTFSGTSITAATGCSSVGAKKTETVGYTATATSFKIIAVVPTGMTQVATFTKG
ncbi:MAG: hypothetical protein NVS3B20_11920 [Polyangiales bacterium]